jgi:hypothetical protein
VPTLDASVMCSLKVTVVNKHVEGRQPEGRRHTYVSGISHLPHNFTANTQFLQPLPPQVRAIHIAMNSTGQKSLDDVLCCDICTEPYDDKLHRPLMLPACGHTFCRWASWGLLCKTFFGQQQNISRTAQWHSKICCRAQGEHCLLLSSVHAFEAKVMLFSRWHSPAGYSGLQQTDPGGGGGVHNSSKPSE